MFYMPVDFIVVNHHIYFLFVPLICSFVHLLHRTREGLDE